MHVEGKFISEAMELRYLRFRVAIENQFAIVSTMSPF